MFRRSLGRAVLTGLVLLAVPFCLPEVTWADEEAELIAAFAQGEALREKGDYPGAAKAFERALALAPRVLGTDHPDTAAIMNNLGWMYQRMGQYTQAKPLFQRSLEILESKVGPDHPDVAVCLHNLALVYQGMDQYAKAEPLYQRSRKIREEKLGPDHPLVADSLTNLALLYQNMGQYAKAEPLFQRSLKIREEKLGPGHPHVAVSVNNLAALYCATGQYIQAELLLQQSLKITESKFGADHLAVLMTLHNLALVYQGMGQYAKAESLYQRSLKILESSRGPDHLDVARTQNNLANLYSGMGQYAKAEPLYQRSLKIREEKLGPDHPLVAHSLSNLANFYKEMGQYAKAVPIYQRSLKTLESKLGPDHPDVALCLHNLASLYQEAGQFAEAMPLYELSLTILESKLAPDHPAVALTLQNLAALCRDMGRYTQAEQLYEQSLKITESKLGSDHPDVARILQNLALLFESMGQHAQAELFYQRSLKIKAAKLGADHPAVATTLYNLAILYANTDRWSEAVAETEKERRIIRRHIARTLPALNEKEQLTFLQTQDEEYLYLALSLGLLQRADADTAQRSAGWILNGKAVAQEVLAQRAILAAEGTDPALADLVKQLLAIRSQLASLSLALPKSGQDADYHQRLDTLGQQEQELSRQLGQATSSDSSGAPWVEPATVRKSLAKEALLIEIARFRVRTFNVKKGEPFWSLPHYVAWLIPAEEQGQITIVDLGDAQPIDEAVQRARKALEKAETTIPEVGEAGAEKQLRLAMRDCARMVFEPLEKHFGEARELALSPDAALWLLPWGALPLADGKYAIEKYQIRYVISGRDLVSQGTNSSRKSTDPILFANPDYDLAPTQVDVATRAVLSSAIPPEQVASSRGLGSLSGLPRVGRLPGTAEEAAAIKSSVTRYAGAEPTIYEDQYAVEGIFKALHRPRVLVLSTHGFFMPDQEVEHKDDRIAGLAGEGSQSRAVLTKEGKPLENPLLRCGLLLAGCNQRVEDAPAGVDDGILTGLEIVGTDLKGTDLVVLSACETGLGQVRNGEGVAGLRQAFQLAGAKAVVSTLWQIPDQETVQLMTDFFANLSAGQSKADALRNAQLAMIKARRESNFAAHPYYWAAFTLTGE